jgi:hypothetical protein
MNKQDLIKVIFDKDISINIPVWLIILLIIAIVLWNILREFDSIFLFWSKILAPLYKRFRLRLFEKQVTKYDIEEKVQKTMSKISAEVPSENIKKLSISYVTDTDEESFIKDNKIYIRVKPFYESQEQNFLNITSFYLDCVLIPKTKTLLSKERAKSLVDYTIYKMLDDESLKSTFHDEFFYEHKKIFPNLQGIFDDLQYIDRRGMLYSIVIRGIENAYRNVQFSSNSIDGTFDAVIAHTKKFLQALKGGNVQEDQWKCNAPNTSYAILLVANPKKAKFVSPRGYINKVVEHLDRVSHVYAVFSGSEWNQFGKTVSKGIETNNEIKLVETIYTSKDYRKHDKGIIKVYAKQQIS